MFLKTLIILVFVAVVSSQDSQLEQDCHILQSLDDVMNRLSSAETEIARTKSALINAETQVTNLKSSLTNTETHVANLKSSLTTADTKIDQQATEIAAIQGSLTTEQTKTAALQDSLRIADSKIDQQATEIATLQDFLTTADTKIYQQGTEIATLQKSQTTAETEKTNLKTSQTEANETPNVVFTARETNSSDVVAGQAIIFPTVQTNVSGGYDPSTGVFTAPYSGLYMFTTTVCAYSGTGLVVHLVAAGTSKASTLKYNNDGLATCTSISSVAVLNTGEKASVNGTVSETDAMYTGGRTFWPSFAGMLVHKT